MTHLSHVAPRDVAHSFIALFKAVVHVMNLNFCDCDFHSVHPLMEKDNRLMETSLWERLTGGKTRSGWREIHIF